MQKIHALWKCQRLDTGLGPLLSRIQTHLKTTPSGEQNITAVVLLPLKTDTRQCVKLCL